jgi:hypothetical protein
MPITVTKQEDVKGKTFEWLYTPYQRKGEKQSICWVQNEPAKVKIELANPTAIDLEIQSIELW